MKRCFRPSLLGMILAGGLLLAAQGALASPARVTPELPLPSNPRYAFEHIERAGLSTKTVTALLQDRQGFLWIGTQSGLVRFDGTDVVTFGREEGLPTGFIDQLLLSPNGTVWAGTASGVARFNGKRFVTLKLPSPTMSIQPIHQLFAIDRHGGTYIATSEGLLWIDSFDPNRTRLMTSKDGLPRGPIDALYFGSDGVLWFAVGHRLGRLRAPTARPEILPAGIGRPNEAIIAILVDGEQKLWVRTSEHLESFDLGTSKFVMDDAGIPGANEFGSPSFDRRGNLLVPTVNGLFRRIIHRWQAYGERQGMSSEAVYAALEDREGAIWIGYGGMGLDRWPNPGTWSGWGKAEGLPDNVVWCMLRDRQGRLWVGTNKGLAMWSAADHSWRTRKQGQGLAGSIVRQLTLDKDGLIWALSYPGGLTRIDPASMTLREIRVQPANARDPNGMAVAPDNKLWIGNAQYLKTVSNEKGSWVFRTVSFPAEVLHSTSHPAFSADGVLWTCGRNGIARFDGKNWLHFTTKDGLRSDVVTQVVPAGANEIWFRYDEALGLGHLRLSGSAATVEHITTAQGMRSDAIYMIGLDQAGNVWTGGASGVSWIDSQRRITNLTRADGLLWDDVSDDAFRAETDGSVLIGTSRGLSRYAPSSATRAVHSAAVVITSVRLGNLERLAETNPEAKYSQRVFSAHFVPLTFDEPQRYRCRYRLNGLESEFTETALREVRYPFLGAGSYVFEVSCRLDKSEWSEPATFSFSIQPAWWERWWARLLEAVLLISLIYLVLRIRTAALEADRRRLEAAVAARSAELAAANRELAEAALTDPLTGIRNRRFFDTMIAADISQTIRAYSDGAHSTDHRDLVFYLVDIDHFKEINDVYGHHVGDDALLEMAQRFSRAVRTSDMLIRWGGEEFLIVSRGAERREAQALAARILSAVASEPISMGHGKSLLRTCSVGWASFPWFRSAPEAVSLEEVLTLVDRALYMAKNSGRNQAIGVLAADREPADLQGELSLAEPIELEGRNVRILRLHGPVA
jgi:diguanylate cyclase (GGDEF)-like protein